MNEKNTIGVAMVVRNAQDTIEDTLEPFIDVVDHIAIVHGGVSDDKTAYMIGDLATLPVEQCMHYDEDGRLTNFAAARALSFDILQNAGVKYAIVVDAEEQWSGVDTYLSAIVEDMETTGSPITLCVGTFGDGARFEQPRIYRIDSGQWFGVCHNWFELDDLSLGVYKTSLLAFHSVRITGPERRAQNIKLAREWLQSNTPHPRVVFHLAADLMGENDFDEALSVVESYFGVYGETDKYAHLEELAQAHYMRAGLFC